MFTGIPLSQIKTRPLIEIPRPQPVLGSDGRPQLRDNKPLFNVKAAPIDFMMSKVNPVKTFFSERFIIDPKQRAKPVEIAVFFYLANTTEWSNVEIIINGDGQPIFTTDGNGQAVIVTYGNRSATRTLQEIADKVGASYGTVQKALAFWEHIGIMARIREYQRNTSKIHEHQAGRRIEYRRYEFDPQYVWNGHIWIGNGYNDFLQGKIQINR